MSLTSWFSWQDSLREGLAGLPPHLYPAFTDPQVAGTP